MREVLPEPPPFVVIERNLADHPYRNCRVIDLLEIQNHTYRK